MPSGIPGTWETTLSAALIAHQRTVSAPRLSPDGLMLAFAGEYDGRTDLFVVGEEGWPRQVTADHALAGGKLRLVAGRPAVRDDGGDGWEALALPGERRGSEAVDVAGGAPSHAAVFAGWAVREFRLRSRSTRSTSWWFRWTGPGSGCSTGGPIFRWTRRGRRMGRGWFGMPIRTR